MVGYIEDAFEEVSEAFTTLTAETLTAETLHIVENQLKCRSHAAWTDFRARYSGIEIKL